MTNALVWKHSERQGRRRPVPARTLRPRGDSRAQALCCQKHSNDKMLVGLPETFGRQGAFRSTQAFE